MDKHVRKQVSTIVDRIDAAIEELRNIAARERAIFESLSELIQDSKAAQERLDTADILDSVCDEIASQLEDLF